MVINLKEITEIDFSQYGKVYDMVNGGEGLVQSSGEGWVDCYTMNPLIDTPGSLGNTTGSPIPAIIKEMERHHHSQEAQFCMEEPFVLLVASTVGDKPNIEDIEGVIVRPGTVVVLERSVWHSASRGLTKDCSYYWMCEVYEGEPSEWQEIEGGFAVVEEYQG